MKIAKRSDWNNEPMPVQRTDIKVSRTFSSESMEQIRAGVVPEQMEDKWFIFWEDDRLFFHRSWTGFCIYMMQFEETDVAWRVREAVANRDPEQYGETDAEYDALMVSFLVDRLLLGKPSEFPSKHTDHDKAILETWQAIGRAMQGE